MSLCRSSYPEQIGPLELRALNSSATRRSVANQVSLVLCLLFTILSSVSAEPFRITQLQSLKGRVVVEHESETASYHVLNKVNLVTGALTPVSMAPGTAKSGRLEDGHASTATGYYRVTRILNEDAQDSDGDGMDDLYEMRTQGLNPLNPKDASQISPTTGRSNLDDYYREESNLVLYPYLVGRGIHDVTGPAADGGMMGYAEGAQRSGGLHDRQWARAFIAAGRSPGSPRVVFVVVDAGQVFHSITQGVNDRLQADAELAPYYSYANIVLSATHTHGAAGGHSHHVLYNATIGGFAWQTYDAMVHGIYMAIKKAHRSMAPGRILLNQGALDNANENRQAEGFKQNVETWHPALGNPFGKDNRDTEMLCLRFEQSNRREIGMFNWFPVHGVSFSKENRLLTGDNKGLAAYMFEKEKGARYPGHSDYGTSSGFVAGFANSNPGDLTANRRTLEPGGWPANGKDDETRASIIGSRQFQKALALYKGNEGKLSRVFGPVDYRHMYVAMTSVVVNPPRLYPYNVPGVGFPTHAVNPPWATYVGALGVDFAKGTLDGEGMSQEAVDLFRKANGLFPDPITDEFELRHAPKEVLLTTGTIALEGMTWTPQIVPVSILRIGNLAILSVPGEFTSIAGSRLRKTVEAVLPPGTHTILAGLANDYSGYITTFEEYIHETTSPNNVPNQSYEAASTQFGAFTLAAYQTQFTELAKSLISGKPVTSRPMPRTQEPASFILKALDPIVDLPPLPQTKAAEFKGKAGCPDGQFLDIITGYCWSCPAGYNRTLFSIDGSTACESPQRSEFSSATRQGAAGCKSGQFFDLLTGYCWSCPAGYNRTLAAVNAANACELPARSVFASANRFGQAGCAPGQFFDLASGYCWSCPAGYNRTVFDINSGAACEKPELLDYASATRHGQAGCGPGQFFDLVTGACWSCPSGYNRTLFAIGGANACELPARSEFIGANSAPGTGFFGTDCPGGYAYDFILRSCYACPSGSSKLVFKAWNDGGACERVIPASYSGASRFNGLCAAGEFLDIGTGACFTCPAGYNRTVLSVLGGTACERRTPAQQSKASRFNGLCPVGQFWDLGTGGCFACPSGFNRTIFGVLAANACEQVIPAVLSSATRNDPFCPVNQFWDIGTGSCFTCPANYNRTVFSVLGSTACEHIIPAVPSLATRHDPFACENRGGGWFLDIGRNECWSCNGWTRNLNAVTAPDACTGPLAKFGDLVTDPFWLGQLKDRVFRRGQQVSVSFWGGHPKNVFGTRFNRFTDSLPTFLDVQRWNGSSWQTIRTDADWDTTFRWERIGVAASKLTLTWNLTPEAPLGLYRVVHRGFSLDTTGGINAYLGESPQFQVTQ